MTADGKAFNFTAILTALVVVGYIGVSAMAYLRAGISWQEFSAAVGPIAGTVLGYWFRGVKQ